jgi:putative oxidoreductase
MRIASTPQRLTKVHMSPNNIYAAFGRFLIAIMFILSGLGKIAAPEATQGYIASVGLPLPMLSYLLAIFAEVGGGILLLLGYRARIVSLALAIFAVVTALVFHHNFADQNQMIHFLKDFAIAGGLLQIAAFGSGAFSLDGRLSRAP